MSSYSSSVRGVRAGSSTLSEIPSRPCGVRVTVLLCTLNEEQNLARVLQAIPDWVDEVLIVDGHSTDRTVERAKAVKPGCRVLSQPGRGKGDALRYGFKMAQGDIIVTLDGDGQNDPTDIPKFLRALHQGHDFAKGTRFSARLGVKGRSLYREVGNWVITFWFNLLFERNFTDLCSGYNAFWKDLLEVVDMKSPSGLADEPLLNVRVAKAGLRVVEVPHVDYPRVTGRSKAPGVRQGALALWTILRERFLA